MTALPAVMPLRRVAFLAAFQYGGTERHLRRVGGD